MKDTLIIAGFPVQGQVCVAAVHEQEWQGRLQPVDFRLSTPLEDVRTGDIYVGRIERLRPDLGAAFVRFRSDQNGYLKLDGDAIKAHHQGETILVQIDKEAVMQKLPRLTDKLTLGGTYAVATSDCPAVHVSRRLSAPQRQRLRDLVTPLLDGQSGLIVRTEAAEAADETVRAACLSLQAQMNDLLEKGKTRSLYTCLHRSPRPWQQLLRQIRTGQLGRIVTDLPEVFADCAALFPDAHLERPPQRPASLAARREQKGTATDGLVLQLWQDTEVQLYQVHKLTSLYERLLAKKVYLKSGGFLVIEETEAFVAIDVNSGRYAAKGSAKDKDDALADAVNREAAAEIARQLRLRELSGSILVDFLNMRAAESKAQLLAYMQQLLQEDPSTARAVDVTALGIMELTRARRRPSLSEQHARLQGEGICAP